jgi:surface antigen
MGVQAGVLCLAASAALSACAASPPGRSRQAGAWHSDSVECAPYARQVSGIQLSGDAADWWDGAAGRYQRSMQPSPGAVLVFRRTARLPHGHVSVVTSLRTAREIIVTQANWVHGRIARDEPVVDVSPANDWSAVRVWWEPGHLLGTTTYPAYGFIAPRPDTGALMSEAALPDLCPAPS